MSWFGVGDRGVDNTRTLDKIKLFTIFLQVLLALANPTIIFGGIITLP